MFSLLNNYVEENTHFILKQDNLERLRKINWSIRNISTFLYKPVLVQFILSTIPMTFQFHAFPIIETLKRSENVCVNIVFILHPNGLQMHIIYNVYKATIFTFLFKIASEKFFSLHYCLLSLKLDFKLSWSCGRKLF